MKADIWDNGLLICLAIAFISPCINNQNIMLDIINTWERNEINMLKTYWSSPGFIITKIWKQPQWKQMNKENVSLSSRQRSSHKKTNSFQLWQQDGWVWRIYQLNKPATGRQVLSKLTHRWNWITLKSCKLRRECWRTGLVKDGRGAAGKG